MVRIALALIFVPLVATAADDWWSETEGADMPTLVAEGYTIVGFSTLAETSPIMPLKVNRYVLQKDTSAYLCVEKLSATTSATMRNGCYAIRRRY